MLVQVFFWFLFFLSIRFFLLDSIILVGSFSFFFSLIICILISRVFSTWFAAIVVIVYVGGLLVIFSYFLAVSPNQTVNSRYSNFLSCLVLSFLAFFLNLSVFYCPVSLGGVLGADYLFSSDSGSIFIFFVLFLLFCLFCVVSIVQLCEGPLRPFSS